MQDPHELVKLSDSGLTVADPAEDVRHRDVIDRDGDKIGTVDDLYIDTKERRVRLLDVGSGGFLGIGEQKVLIPIDDITRLDPDHVYINQSRQFVGKGPTYDPRLAPDRTYANTLYSYYGYSPYWAPGYLPPPFPNYPISQAERQTNASREAEAES